MPAAVTSNGQCHWQDHQQKIQQPLIQASDILEKMNKTTFNFNFNFNFNFYFYFYALRSVYGVLHGDGVHALLFSS